MKKKPLDETLIRQLLVAQRNEITENRIYDRLARSFGNTKNAKLFQRLAHEELMHYQFWKRHTGRDVKPSGWKIFKYFWIARLFGVTFGVKLMENGEGRAEQTYAGIARSIPEAQKIAEDEDRHERQLLELIDEERLQYVGSMVLGLNDALVELTGALAGFTFALQNTRLIALAGLITGIAASFSMAASEYLSTKSEQEQKSPLKSAVYTGVAYIITVALLIAPYLIFSNYLFCLAVTLAVAILIILVFTYYISVAKDLPFRRRFAEMALISLGVAALSFGIGYVIRRFLGIEV